LFLMSYAESSFIQDDFGSLSRYKKKGLMPEGTRSLFRLVAD